MRGTVLYGPRDVRFEERDEPKILKPTDVIIRLSATCVCGSDLWPYRGIQKIEQPTPMGHEYCGMVEEVGSAVKTVKKGQFVVGSFCISDNTCPNCRAGYQSGCQNLEFMSGAQAPYARVPFADGTLVFEVMKIPVIQGRSFSEGDSHGTTSVAIVNQAFVKKYFVHAGGMGQPILIGRQEGPQFADSSRAIIGIVADTRENALNEEPSPSVFVPLAQVPDTFLAFTNSLMPINWLIRVSGDPLTFARTVHSNLLTVDGDLVASHPRPLPEVLSGSLSQSRLEASIVGFFSGAALLLGAIGLYALLAYSVNERKREIGIRLALGADQSQILRLVIVQGLKLTVTGICIGVAIGVALSRFMNSLLFGVGATDPLTFVVVVAVLILVAIAACYVPAYRAMRVDPIVALRYE